MPNGRAANKWYLSGPLFGAAEKVHELHPLDPLDAARLLLKRAPRRIEPDELNCSSFQVSAKGNECSCATELFFRPFLMLFFRIAFPALILAYN